MAFRCLKLLRVIRSTTVIRHNSLSASVTLPEDIRIRKPKEFRTENNLIYLEDPDTFGTLSRNQTQSVTLEDEGDKKEEQYIQNAPLKSQKLTTRQYADLMKQYLKHKRLKEAIDVLEVRMLKEDRVKPENYIYNILIGACADVGYTKKAFKLYNEMKRRGLKATGDTYTCLFHACSNSPWPLDGLKNAKKLRELMIDKGIEPNLTNYNAMIKAFGRCGDLAMAFKIVDEMVSKKINIRVHTFNHLLQACISDKSSGLRHALVVWRKMLRMREKPNIYSFNLMLKCVKDCNLGGKEDIEELIGIIQEQIVLDSKNNALRIESTYTQLESQEMKSVQLLEAPTVESKINNEREIHVNKDSSHNCPQVTVTLEETKDLAVIEDKDRVTIHVIDSIQKVQKKARTLPNLLSKVLKMQQVTSLQEVQTVQEKFAVVGGQEDFLKEMQASNVKPDVKTFTQMLPLLEDTVEAETKLLETMKTMEIKADIDFYNMLIKKRSLRSDYDAAFAVRQIIKMESEYRKKRYPLSKKLKLKVNIMTYGVLAMACKTKESAEKLLNEMQDEQLKVNIEILGTLLRQGTACSHIGYVMYIMNVVKQANIPVNNIFLKHLEDFNDKCSDIIRQRENGKRMTLEKFEKAYQIFSNFYTGWLKNVNIEDALKPEHPWQQFRESCPETVQRPHTEIETPKKFYKRNRKYVPPYAAKLK